VAASSSNRLRDGSRSGTQPPRIAMQRIWTAGQVNVAWGPKFWLPFDERKTLKNTLFHYKYTALIFATKVKSKGIDKNAGNVAKILINLVILQNYFRKLLFFGNKFVKKFYKHKNKCNVTHKFFRASRRNLARSCNLRGKGGRAGGSYELDAARSNQNKLLFHILDIPGGILLKAQEPSKFNFLLLVMKKDIYNGIFSRRILKTK
jgi:hypothetical protein